MLELDVAKGTYTRLYALETSLIPDDRWTQMNSAGINPIDGIAYASVLVDEIPFLVRFSRDELDFVAKLPVDSFSGTFDSKGNYYIDYFERKPTNMYMLWKIESVDTFRGTKVYNSTSLADLSDMPATAQTNLTNEFTLDDGKVARILQLQPCARVGNGATLRVRARLLLRVRVRLLTQWALLPAGYWWMKQYYRRCRCRCRC